MHDSKLIELLTTFDKEDWGETSTYLKHTLEKTSREAVLFDHIKRYKNNLASSKLKIDVAQKALFPNISLQSFRNTIYHLTALIEKHLLLKYIERRENHFEHGILMAKIYKERGLSRQLASEIRSLTKKAEKSGTMDVWREAHLSRLYYESYFSDVLDKSLDGRALLKNAVSSFEAHADQLNLIYLTEITNRADLYNEDWDVEIASLLEKKKAGKSTAFVKLLRLLFEAVNNKNEESYQKVKSEFLMQKDFLSAGPSFFILVKLFNLCMYLIAKGFSKLGRDMLKFYDIGLSNGVLLKNKKLSEKRFLNIVDLACKLDEREWVQRFRTQWSENVETLHPEKVMALADAYEYFALKKFNKTLDTLEISFHGQVDLSLRAHWLKLCSLYEVYEEDKEDKLERYIGSFKFYLHNNKKKISEENLKGSKNLIKIVELLISYESVEKIRAFVKDCQFLVFRSWVEGKTD